MEMNYHAAAGETKREEEAKVADEADSTLADLVVSTVTLDCQIRALNDLLRQTG